MISILIVEDEGIVAMDLKQRLEGMGYSVSAIAASCRDVLRKAELTAPDIVLMDIIINDGIDGIETARMLTERYDLPVIFISAYTDQKTIERAMGIGPYGYIVKPFEDRQLQVNIEVAVHKHSVEKAVRESEERFKRLSEASFEGILVHDRGMVVDLNDRLSQMLGYPPRQLVGLDLFALAMPGYREFLGKGLLPESGGPQEVVMKRKDGTLFPAEIVDRDLPYRGLMFRVAAIRDISFRKQIEGLMKDRSRSVLYGFVVSALPLIAPGALQSVREDLLRIFAERFEEYFKKSFDSEMKRQGFESMPAEVDALDSYLGWVAELFSTFGIRARASSGKGRGVLELRECPWIEYARKNPVFCLLCRTMGSRSFSWASPRGAMGLRTTMAAGNDCCRLEFMPAR